MFFKKNFIVLFSLIFIFISTSISLAADLNVGINPSQLSPQNQMIIINVSSAKPIVLASAIIRGERIILDQINPNKWSKQYSYIYQPNENFLSVKIQVFYDDDTTYSTAQEIPIIGTAETEEKQKSDSKRKKFKVYGIFDSGTGHHYDLEIKGVGEDSDTDDVTTALGFGAEYIIPLSSDIELAPGFTYYLQKEFDESGVEGKYSYLPIYCKLNKILNTRGTNTMYIGGRLHYCIFNSDDDYKGSDELKDANEIGYGFHFGMEISEDFYFELAYLVLKGKVSGDQVDVPPYGTFDIDVDVEDTALHFLVGTKI